MTGDKTMDTTNGTRARMPVGDLRSALPKLAVLLALLAALMAWSGIRQWRDAGLLEDTERARDQAVEAVLASHAAQVKQLEQRLASAPVKAALAANDTAAAAAVIRDGWSGAEQVEILDGALMPAYDDAGTFGYSKLALLEAGMQGDAVATRVVKDGKQTSFGLAAAVPQGVVYVRLPLARLTDGFERVAMPADGYLALRQGGYSIAQRGNSRLADGAERMAHAVGKTGLRVATAAPDSESGPLGLGAIPALVVAALLAGLAIAAVLVARGGLRLGNIGKKGTDMHDTDEPTLGEALLRDPPPASAGRAVAASEEGGDDAYRQAEGKAVEVDPGIFRAYDIRGIVGTSLSVEVAELIGLAIGSVMRDEDLTDIVVGRDGRLSGPDLAGGLIEGLRKAGRNVIDIGLAPTPVAYFGAYHLRAGSCVAVTGSHNPPDYNGFKIVVGGETLSGATITDLYTRISEGRLHSAERGGLTQREIAEDYVQRIAGDVQLARPLKVVVDAGNGVAGEIAPVLLEAIGAEVVPLYCDIDGTFPNHHPDPSEPDNLLDLASTVKRFEADLGLAFDGDGDRVGVVTNTGTIIYPDRLLMLFAKDVVSRNPGADIIFDVKCTRRLIALISGYGGRPVMWKTGHSLIKKKMKETGALLAGEMSGHVFFKERWFGFDDGIYSAARLLEILSQDQRDSEHVFSAFPSDISTPEINITVTEDSKFAIIEALQRDAQWGEGNITTLDGVRVDYPKGWGLVRASNTTPVLVLRFEADTEEELERIKTVFRNQLKAVDSSLPVPF